MSDKSNTLLVNLFAGPGCGKSTMAAGLFYELKMAGINCELVTEYVKDKVWEESFSILDNQVYILGKQFHKLNRVSGKVDVIITDSPLLLGLCYGDWESEEYKSLVIDLHNRFRTLDVNLTRSHKYEQSGRMENEEQAIEKDQIISKIVNNYGKEIVKCESSRKSVADLVSLIKTLI